MNRRWFYLHSLKTQHDSYAEKYEDKRRLLQRNGFCRVLLFKVTYMSSLVWRSMGSWVSLSMWKRTSKEDSVSALNDIKMRFMWITTSLNIQLFAFVFLLFFHFGLYPFSILCLLRILASLFRPRRLFVISSFLLVSSILIWASAYVKDAWTKTKKIINNSNNKPYTETKLLHKI